jgi:hypothetical protein
MSARARERKIARKKKSSKGSASQVASTDGPRLSAPELEELALKAVKDLRAAGCDSVVVGVHCTGGIGPWHVRYDQSQIVTAVPFWTELGKYLVGLLGGWWSQVPTLAQGEPKPEGTTLQ